MDGNVGKSKLWAMIADQIGMMQEAMSKRGIAELRDEYLLEDGIAGLQGIQFPDEHSAESEFGAPLAALLLHPKTEEIVILERNGPDNMRSAAEQLFENISEFVLNQNYFDINNAVHIQLSPAAPIQIQVDTSPTEEPLLQNWQPPQIAEDEPAPSLDSI